jgi:hypothetical protein
MEVDAMNRRMMTFATIGAVVALSAVTLSAPAWAQTGPTAGPGSVQGSAQSNLGTYGTESPVVAGAGNAGAAGTATVGTAPGSASAPAGAARIAGAQLGMSSPMSSPGATTTGGSGLATGLTATTGTGIGTPPMAGNTSAQATAGTTGTAASTGMTLACASSSAAVGVLPEQMPSDCLP